MTPNKDTNFIQLRVSITCFLTSEDYNGYLCGVFARIVQRATTELARTKKEKMVGNETRLPGTEHAQDA